MKIKVKYFDNDENHKLKINPKGDWIDLRATEEVTFFAPQIPDTGETQIEFDSVLVGLNIAMELPKGFEAIVAARSSTFKHFKIIIRNGIGIIDCSYNGDEDQWKCPIISFGNETIHIGDRVCQFKIQPSQFATRWQKIKWLFTKRIKFVEVEHLGNTNRGGFGATGKN